MSRTMSSGSDPSSRTPFQCVLFMCQAPVISGWMARSCSARAGSHFRLTDQSAASMADNANILASCRAPPATAARTLKTEVSGPNGKSSKAPGKLRQISRRVATSMKSSDRAYLAGLGVRRPLLPTRRALPVRLPAVRASPMLCSPSGVVPLTSKSPTVRALNTAGLWVATVRALRQCRSSDLDFDVADAPVTSKSCWAADWTSSGTSSCAFSTAISPRT